jgi:hypothetical protein
MKVCDSCKGSIPADAPEFNDWAVVMSGIATTSSAGVVDGGSARLLCGVCLETELGF